MRNNYSEHRQSALLKRNVYAIGLCLVLSLAVAHVQAGGPPEYQESSTLLYQDALQLMFHNKYTEAITKFESLISNFPRSTKVANSAYHIGYCYEKLGNRKEAFAQYKDVITAYNKTVAARQATVKAIGLAKSMRQVEGDEYDNFLKESLHFISASDYHKRLSAIRMAEFGNWQGIDLIIEAMEKGSLLEQIRASDLLRYKVNDGRVQIAFKKALETRKHTYVKMNALSALSRLKDNKSVQDVIVSVMLQEPDEVLRSNAARSLSLHIEEKKIKEAFATVIQHERHPFVLQVVSNIVLSDERKEYFAPFVVQRLENETNPMVKLLLSNSLLGSKYQNAKVELVVKSMADNPAPDIRINALRILKSKSSDPEIKYIFINKLKNDPNENVKIVAMNALKDQALDDSVREVFFETINTTNDVILVTTSIKAMGTYVQVPKVRKDLVITLRAAQAPIVANQIVYILASQLESPDVKGVIVEKLREPGKYEMKFAITSALSDIEFHTGHFTKELEELFLHEKNERLSQYYLTFLYKADPDSAKKLKELKLHRVKETSKDK